MVFSSLVYLENGEEGATSTAVKQLLYWRKAVGTRFFFGKYLVIRYWYLVLLATFQF